MIDRRTFLLSAAATAVLPAWAGAPGRTLRAGPGRAQLTGGMRAPTEVWCYDGTVPGPELRVRQGEPVRVTVQNQLAEPTTVHWHGIRLPNAMDGVPDLTQPPILPGGSFTYEFTPPDAGTFWYHPHQRSFEQVGRGLSGALIVEEAAPPQVDRDVTWMLQDWRLTRDGTIASDFGNRMDMAMAGRLGNTVTINSAVPEAFAVRAGERIRLRLINAANARIFGLEFAGHSPMIVAWDGQPVAPHAPDDGRVVLGPAMRADLILDMSGEPGGRYAVTDMFYRGLEYRLVELAYAATPLRTRAPDAPIALPPNPLAQPDLGAARRHDVSFGGGMMGGQPMTGHSIWTINGIAAHGHAMAPLLTLARRQSHVLALHNDTAWHHPMHLHGHSFRVIGRNGSPAPRAEWRDTLLMAPREHAEIALVADNPGDWMFHCHILEHQEGGMMGVIRVA